MRILTSIYELPNVPAVYALYGGQGRRLYVAYVADHICSVKEPMMTLVAAEVINTE